MPYIRKHSVRITTNNMKLTFWQSSFASRRYLLHSAILHSVLVEAGAVGAAPEEPAVVGHVVVQPVAASGAAIVVVAAEFVVVVAVAVAVAVVEGLVVESAVAVVVAVIDFGIALVVERRSCSVAVRAVSE